MVTKTAFLIAGDSFLVEEKAKGLAASLEKKIRGEVTRRTFRLGENPLAEVLRDARTLPFLAAAQIFMLREAEEIKKKDLETLASYLEHPSDTTFLIFQSDTLTSSSELTALVAKSGECYFLDAKDRRGAGGALVREKLRTLGKSAQPDALARLETQAEEAPAFLDSLLEQLATYAGDKKEITEEMVEAFEERWAQTDAFKLTDALGRRQTGEAVVLLRKILDQGEHDAISLVGMLHWHIRRLWQVRALLEDGEPESVILKKCKIYPKQAPFILRQVKLFTLEALENALEGLFQADWKAKTGQTAPEEAIELWVVRS